MKFTLLRRLTALLSALLLTMSELAAPLPTEEVSVLDEEELYDLISPVLERSGATERNFGFAFCYTATGETYYLHPDSEFYSASLYKVPLSMLCADRVFDGEMEWSSPVRGGMTLEYNVSRALIWSDNNTAGELMLWLGAPYDHYLLSRYSGLSKEELPKRFENYTYTPRFMMNTMKTLYDHPERYSELIGWLSQAAPEDFFRKNLNDRYVIAQKYGQWDDGELHTAGIIYTPNPIIVVIMCQSMHHQRTAIEELAPILADYALVLDSRLPQGYCHDAYTAALEKYR